jgi:uncharacterized membrane protein
MDITISNFLHLLASVIWIGGAAYIHIILMPVFNSIVPQEGGKLQCLVAKPFSIVVWVSIILLIIIGILKTPSAMLW